MTFIGRDSINAANTAIKIVAGTGIMNKAHIAPATKPIVPSNDLFLFHGNLCLPYLVPTNVANPSPRANISITDIAAATSLLRIPMAKRIPRAL